jgi:hypothetical protein
MNKKVLKIIGGVLIASLIFGVGNFTGASTDWQTTSFLKANDIISGAGFDKKEEIAGNAQADILKKIDSEIGETIETESAELQRLLDQYYKMKLENLDQSPEFLALEKRIAEITDGAYARFKAEIDALFAVPKP